MYVFEENVSVRDLSGVCREDGNVVFRHRMGKDEVYVVSDGSRRSRYRGDGECGEDQCVSNYSVLLGREVDWGGMGQSLSEVDMGNLNDSDRREVIEWGGDGGESDEISGKV